MLILGVRAGSSNSVRFLRGSVSIDVRFVIPQFAFWFRFCVFFIRRQHSKMAQATMVGARFPGAYMLHGRPRKSRSFVDTTAEKYGA